MMTSSFCLSVAFFIFVVIFIISGPFSILRTIAAHLPVLPSTLWCTQPSDSFISIPTLVSFKLLLSVDKSPNYSLVLFP